jgi:hypothetical protein
MPKIRRSQVPKPILDHLLDRLDLRQISYIQLSELSIWLATNPTVPAGRWFKRFGNFTICGEGEFVKTFLIPGQVPDGEEVN